MAGDPLTNMSGLTKVHAGAILASALVAVFGIIFQARIVGCAGLGILVGTALMTALDDPEAEEPLALPLRIALGYGAGAICGLILFAAGAVWT